MTSPIASTSVTAPAAARYDASSKAATKVSTARSQPEATGSTQVTLSSAVVAALASLKEAVETPAQTAKEASHNDIQAQHLLAREAAQKAQRA